MRRALLVTGGSRGIGAATARLAAGRGWDVAISYRTRKDEAERVVADCEAAGARALAVPADIAVESDVRELFEAVNGWGELGALVNNAGIVAPRTRLEEFTAERIERVIAVNLTGALLCAREAVRRMSTRHGGDGGAIVNVTSRAAVLGSPGEYVDYAAAKAGVDTLTVGLSKELAADGIRVNAVRPGLIDTEIQPPGRVEQLAPTTPLGRAGTGYEVATAICWLLSDEASYATGSVLDVSGGR